MKILFLVWLILFIIGLGLLSFGGYVLAVNIKGGEKPIGPTNKMGTDRDLDELLDDEETRYGTNPEKADTDGDGLNDYLEIKQYKTNPKIKDTDKDGYTDKQEVDSGHDPLKAAK